jgi:hypothetical protein
MTGRGSPDTKIVAQVLIPAAGLHGASVRLLILAGSFNTPQSGF